MHRKSIVILFFWTLFILTPFISSDLLNKRNDLDGNISQIIYIKNAVAKGIIPQWNPFINQGVPITADPLSAHFHPLVLPAFVFLSPAAAVIFLISASTFLGGIGAYFLLIFLGVTQKISRLTAMTYISCGYLAARLTAGHLEKVLSFGILPFFLLGLLLTHNRKSYTYEVLTAFAMTLILYSGDLYNALYCVILLLSVSVIAGFMGTFRILFSHLRVIGLFLLLGSVKLLPLVELANYISKLKEPFAGSQNVISVLYYFFVPIKPIFIKFGFSDFLQTGFAWWEKTAFLGPIVLVGIFAYVIRLYILRKKDIFYRSALILLGGSLTLVLLSMPATAVNPYKYVLEHMSLLHVFHVPSRTFGLLSCLLLAMAGLGWQALYHKSAKWQKAVLLASSINLFIVAAFFYFVAIKMQRPTVLSKDISGTLIALTSRIENEPVYMAQYLERDPISQYQAVNLQQKVLNSNYGLQLNGSPASEFTKFDFQTTPDYSGITPAYIIGTSPLRIPSGINLHSKTCLKDTCLAKTLHPTPYASTQNGEALKAVIYPNRIIISDSSLKTSTLTILESYYPGWQVTIDGKPARIIQGPYLSVHTQPGHHIYEFTYSSRIALLGFMISVFTWYASFRYLWEARQKMRH